MRASQGLWVFSSLFLAGKGLLAFQGLSRGDGLLSCRLSTRQGGPGRNSPCRPGGTVKSTLGMISATMADPSTIADLRRAGIINSQEIVAAIDVYLRDPAAGPYRFTSGHGLDIAALVSATPAFAAADRSGPQERAFRTVLAAAVMSAHPTAP